MNRVPRGVLLKIFLIFFASGMGVSTHAQTPTPPPPNAILADRAEQIAKQAMRVLNESEGVVTLELRNPRQSFANKTQILFFRRKHSRVEVIADGVVTGDRANARGVKELTVEINRDTIVKYPVAGDLAIPMADPNAAAAGDKKDEFDFLKPEDEEVKKENDRPGYLEIGVGLMQGSMNSKPNYPASDPPVIPDGDKKPNGYRFRDLHGAYYSEYVPIGVEYDSHSGNFPTSTFYQTVVSSSESVSTIALAYRLPTFFDKHLALSLKAVSLSDSFKTDNTDENLLTTKMSGLGFGLHANFDFVSPIWKPIKPKTSGFAFQQLFAEYIDYPSISAQDVGVSRGTSSTGSNATQYKVGFTSLAYLNFVPWFKRWVFQASYGDRSYNLKFQGPTVKEVSAIPQNGSSVLSESDIRFFVGIRVEDPLKLLFSSGDRKDDKKKDKP